MEVEPRHLVGFPAMLDPEAAILAQLRSEWTNTRRLLFLVDEVRSPHSCGALGGLVSFVLVGTTAQEAAAYADEMSVLRDQLRNPADAKAWIKGTDLYGKNRAKHDAIRARVGRAVADSFPGILRWSTSSSALKQVEALAPCGIQPVRESGDAMTAIRGRELWLLMTMVKHAANHVGIGPDQIDVLVDRSAQLGLDPHLLGEPKDQNFILGPGELNQQADGSPASYHCPSRFRFIAPTKPGPFRDLSLLPDAVAYVMLVRGHVEAAWQRVRSGTPFVIEGWSGADIAKELGFSG